MTTAPGYIVRSEGGHVLAVPYDWRGMPMSTVSHYVASTLAGDLAQAGWGLARVVHWTPDGERTAEVHLPMARSDADLDARVTCCARARKVPSPLPPAGISQGFRA